MFKEPIKDLIDQYADLADRQKEIRGVLGGGADSKSANQTSEATKKEQPSSLVELLEQTTSESSNNYGTKAKSSIHKKNET